MNTINSVSELIIPQQRLYCPITGLPGRKLFLQRVGDALGRVDSQRGQVGVFLADINGFKTINDSMGHDVGDRVLQAVAKRLSNLAGPHDMVAHFAGDKILFLREQMTDEGSAIEVARQLNAVIADPLSIIERELFLTGTVGIMLASGRES